MVHSLPVSRYRFKFWNIKETVYKYYNNKSTPKLKRIKYNNMIHWTFAHTIMIYNNKLKTIFRKDKNSKIEIMRHRHSTVLFKFLRLGKSL